MSKTLAPNRLESALKATNSMKGIKFPKNISLLERKYFHVMTVEKTMDAARNEIDFKLSIAKYNTNVWKQRGKLLTSNDPRKETIILHDGQEQEAIEGKMSAKELEAYLAGEKPKADKAPKAPKADKVEDAEVIEMLNGVKTQEDLEAVFEKYRGDGALRRKAVKAAIKVTEEKLK